MAACSRRGFWNRKVDQIPVFCRFSCACRRSSRDIDSRPYPFLQPREMAHWTSPIFKYALLVVHRALEKSGIVISADIAPRVAVTFSTAVGGLDAVLQADRLMVAEGKMPHPFTNPNSCINMVGGKVSILTHATGPICSTITACATGNYLAHNRRDAVTKRHGRCGYRRRR